MARARTIKPGFFTNDQLSELSPLCRLLFAGLWTIADREGRMEDRPRRIKAEILPYDDVDVDGLLDQLDRCGFIRRYASGPLRLIQVTKWNKHQNPHVKEAASVLPAPPGHEPPSGGGETEAETPEPEQAPYEHRASTVQAPGLNGTGTVQAGPISNHPFPITHSNRNTSCPMPEAIRAQATEILDHLNTRAGTRYRPVDSTLRFIAARLNEGATVDDCLQVIDAKCREWRATKWAKYLRPETLFNATKFASYVGASTEPERQEALPTNARDASRLAAARSILGDERQTFGDTDNVLALPRAAAR